MLENKKSLLAKMAASLVITAALCFSSVLPAFAAGNPITGGSETNPVQAAVTKYMELPDGSTLPSGMSFSFQFAKKSVDGSEDAADLASMPTIAEKTVTGLTARTTPGANDVYAKETGDILAGLAWPHAGVYRYTVTEKPNTYTIVDPLKEQLSYSTASYELAVYVSNGTTGLYASSVAATIVDADSFHSSATTGDKVDPTPADDGVTSTDFSNMIFTNIYQKTNGGTEPTDSVLKISKEVVGDLANREKYFPFTVNVTKPASESNSAKTYKAYVLDANDTVVTSTDNADAQFIKQDSSSRAYIEFSTGVDMTVNLKHGQWLSFIDLPVGATWRATEAAGSGYIPSANLTLYNQSSAQNITGSENNPLVMGPYALGDTLDIAAVTNTAKEVLPTGISVTSLPYFLLIGVVVLVFSAYVSFKNQRRAKKNAAAPRPANFHN